MAVHQMKLAKIPFEKIVRSQKTIEARLFDEKRRRINIGDCITFAQRESPYRIAVKVIALYHYATFGELFSDFPPAYFGGRSRANLLQEIHQFYSRGEEQQSGVVGIKFKKEKEKSR